MFDTRNGCDVVACPRRIVEARFMQSQFLACLLSLALVIGACGGGESEDGGPQLARFSADIGSSTEEILSTGDLTIEARCRDNDGDPLLSVAVSTATDDAWIASEFETDGGPTGGYRFVMDDFDRDFGPYDFLGTGVDQATGKLTYVSATGGQITIDFVADHSSSQADCLFSGSAVVADG